ncbi:MAG: response regulator transcription factor [Anaerolineae bacterium]|nr:response regulator transcription factor [Anaerolineae bacterium]
MKTILVVDDKPNITRLLRDYLSAQGFRVVAATDGQEALYTARHKQPDLILLDIMMPEMDGYSFIRAYRKERETPIILLTARLEESDKVLGLEMGADDYVTKPFGMSELVARIRAVLRRVEQPPQTAEVLRAGALSLDAGRRLVLLADRSVDLTPSEFSLLAALMTHPGHVFSRLDLLEVLQAQFAAGVRS